LAHERPRSNGRSAELVGALDDAGGERRFVIASPRRLALRRAMLAQHRADPPFRELQLGPDIVDAGAATSGA